MLVLLFSGVRSIVVSAAVVLAIGLGLFLSRTILIPINILRDVAEELGE